MAEVEAIRNMVFKAFLNIMHDIKSPTSREPLSLTESPIEESFLLGTKKFLAQEIEIIPQYWVKTPQGNFRLDFVFKTPNGKSICIECDGQDYHEVYKDFIRDILVLQHGDISEIIRINGFGINFALESCLYFIFKCHPDLLKKDMIQGIEHFLSEREISEINYLTMSDFGFEEVPFAWNPDDFDEYETLPVKIYRREKKQTINPIRFLFSDVINFIESNKELDFEQLNEKYHEKVREELKRFF
jgi:hypothetical protein